MTLPSFPKNSTAVVVGASGGIGAAITAALSAAPEFSTVHALARNPTRVPDGPKIHKAAFDLTDEASIADAFAQIDSPRLIFIATGILHDTAHGPEKSWRALDLDWMEKVMRVNAHGPALIAKHALPKMPREGKSVFAAISARVGSISDNRLGGWYGYRASKAALNMYLRCLAIEHARTHREAITLALHPGTVASDLSAPFQKGVKPEKLFSPEYAAAKLLDVVDQATQADTGTLKAYDGSVIEF